MIPARQVAMKLFYNAPSPYARKVLVLAHELGLVDRLTLVAVDPWRDPPELLEATPLAKVPALVTDGITLTESTAICEHLLRVAGVARPADGARLDLAARIGLAQGLIDASFGTVVERRRPVEVHWSGWIDRLGSAITRTVATVRTPGGSFDLGDITLACALAYLDFRLPEVAWRAARADLAAWLDDVNARASMVATRA
ncbi:MAG: glutathione S-transferase family protein [Rhodoplanes sp.]|uniref:glutathione S-transferase family protein n=1 Tax=Rhodoplanes sp. TaxID=1968906 RepID=UPI001794E6D4|nr:glutathione S-transferase family protein [Rhodoplanes sp.]NVO16336.1 glutathione S-transferase family protein [Rhodoplanes sp.]